MLNNDTSRNMLLALIGSIITIVAGILSLTKGNSLTAALPLFAIAIFLPTITGLRNAADRSDDRALGTGNADADNDETTEPRE